MLNRKGSYRCRRIEAQSKGDVDGPLACSLALGLVAAEARMCIAARQAAGTLPLIGATDDAELQQLRADHLTRLQESANFLLGGPEKRTGAHDPQHALQKRGGLADQWYMDDGDIMCHPILVPSYLREFDVANAKVEAERNPLKTEVIYCVNDLDAAPPERRIHDVQIMVTVSTVTAGSVTHGVVVGSRQFIADQLLSKADVIRAMHERVQHCQDPQTELALLRGSLEVSRINHILRVHGHTILEEQSAAAVFDEIGQRSLERLFPGFTEDSMTQATLSGGQSGIGYKKARDTAAPAHLGALIAAKPRMQAMIQDAFWAQSTSWRLASPRSSKQPPPLVSAHSTATSKQRRSCMFRRRLRRQTKLSSKQLARRHKHDSDGQRTSHLKKKTVTTWTSQRTGRAVQVGDSKRSSHGCLTRLDWDA